jgi:Fe2+ or Zn2+ uptake regulation protein
MTRRAQQHSDRAAAPRRIPKNYQLLLEILSASGRGVHLSINDVFIEAKRRRPSLGLSTVYRGLLRLRDLGLASEIIVPGAASAVYEPASGEHAHFRCSTCEAVWDVDYVLPSPVVQRLANQREARIESVSLTLHGVCKKCLDRRPRKSR